MSFNDNPVQRSASVLRSLRNHSTGSASINNDRQTDTMSVSSRDQGISRILYPFTIHHYGRLGVNGTYILHAESSVARQEWKQKLEESKGLRKVVQESNKVFEIESLSVDTFLLPTLATGPNSSVWHDGTLFTGKVTCSVPFSECCCSIYIASFNLSIRYAGWTRAGSDWLCRGCLDRVSP